MTTRRKRAGWLRVVALLAVCVLTVVTRPGAASGQGGDITVVDHEAHITITTGNVTIREGPPSGQGGGQWLYS